MRPQSVAQGGQATRSKYAEALSPSRVTGITIKLNTLSRMNCRELKIKRLGEEWAVLEAEKFGLIKQIWINEAKITKIKEELHKYGDLQEIQRMAEETEAGGKNLCDGADNLDCAF